MLSKKGIILSVFMVWGIVVAGCGLPAQVPTETVAPVVLPSPDPQADQPTQTTQPVATADPVLATAQPTSSIGAKVNYQGVSFTYDLGLANSVSAKIAPAVPGEPGEIGWIGSVPETYEFTFDGYQLGNTFHTPEILVFPIQDYAAINNLAGEIADDLKTYLVKNDPNAKALPFLPMWNAGQVFYSRATPLSFVNGQGISYLTCYAQAVLPIDEECLFYTFQGTTYDKQFYVVAILPVSHPDLKSAENTAKFNEALDSSDGKKYEEYLDEIRGQLNGWAPDSYLPSLNKFDDLIRSLSVQPTVKLQSPEAAAEVDCPQAMGGRLRVGYPARVTYTDGKALRVRDEPGKSATVLGQLIEGTEMVISGGPVCVGDGLWWKMISSDGKISGWVLEGEDSAYYVEPWQ